MRRNFFKNSKFKFRLVNLNGMSVLPGLHDVHSHIMEASNNIAGTCVLEPDTL